MHLTHAHFAGLPADWHPATWAAAAALFLAGWLYARGVRLGAAVGTWQRAAFSAGWCALALALVSPLAARAGANFALHMVQHELLMVLAPPLLVLGQPYAVLARVLSPTALRAAAAPLRLVSPLAAWGLHALALWIWHVPRLFSAALGSDWVHAAQHASFFLTALLFWWAVFRRLRTGMAVLFVLTTMIHMGALAALLTFAPAPLYPGTSLEAQQLGGLIMWVPAGYAMRLAGILAFDRLLARSDGGVGA
jgi:cytochrome c oxidase assembly factor CtaG